MYAPVTDKQPVGGTPAPGSKVVAGEKSQGDKTPATNVGPAVIGGLTSKGRQVAAAQAKAQEEKGQPSIVDQSTSSVITPKREIELRYLMIILFSLKKAQERFSAKIEAAKKEIKAEEKVQDKQLKAKIERKLQELRVLAGKLKAYAQLAGADNPKVLKKYSGVIAKALAAVRALSAAVISEPINLQAILGRIEEAEGKLEAVREKMQDEPLLEDCFGGEWRSYIKPGALADRTITENELAPHGREYILERFGKFALNAAGKIELTEQKLEAYEDALKRFSLLLGIDPKSVDPKVRKVFEAMMMLAAQGSLKLDDVNRILEENGFKAVHFNAKSFAAVFTRTLSGESVNSVEDLLGAVRDFYYTAQMYLISQGRLSGFIKNIDRVHKEAPHLLGSMLATLEEFARSEDFSIIDIGQHTRITRDILQAYYKIANPAKLLDEVLNDDRLKLRDELAEIRNNRKLSAAEKWELITAVLLKKLLDRLQVGRVKDESDKFNKAMRLLQKLATSVQNAHRDSAMVREYQKQFISILTGDGKLTFDAEKVLGLSAAAPVAAASVGGK